MVGLPEKRFCFVLRRFESDCPFAAMMIESTALADLIPITLRFAVEIGRRMTSSYRIVRKPSPRGLESAREVGLLAQRLVPG